MPKKSMLCSRNKRGFTLVELLTTIALIAILVTLGVYLTSSYLSWSQKVSNERTLSILNNSLQHYKTLGGMTAADGHNLEGANTEAKIIAVLNTLKTGFQSGGSTRSFLNTGEKIDTTKLFATGSGKTFVFTGYGTPNTAGFAGEYVAHEIVTTPPMFVALGSGASLGRVIYSPDGVTWTETTIQGLNTSQTPNVIYGNGKYVMVQRFNAIFYSSDGSSWAQASAPFTIPSGSIAFGNGTFVIAGDGSSPYLTTGTVATSTDGINWTATDTSITPGFQGIAFGNGLFVTRTRFGGTHVTMAYSADGINWSTSQILNYHTNLISYGPYFGGGQFIYHDSTNRIPYSNGTTWTPNTRSVSALSVMIYGNGTFINTGTSTNQVSYSSDGINWSSSTLPVSGNWSTMTAGDGIFVGIAYGTNQAAYSTDGGATWNSFTMPASGNWRINYYDGVWVGHVNSTTTAAYSYDGINWTLTTIPSGVWVHVKIQ